MQVTPFSRQVERGAKSLFDVTLQLMEQMFIQVDADDDDEDDGDDDGVEDVNDEDDAAAADDDDIDGDEDEDEDDEDGVDDGVYIPKKELDLSRAPTHLTSAITGLQRKQS